MGSHRAPRLWVMVVLATLLAGCSASPETALQTTTGQTGRPSSGPTDAGPGTSQNVPPGSPAILVGAGRVGRCGPVNHQTAALVDEIDGIVFTLGDNAYGEGTAEQFAECYEPAWGRFRQRTRPVPGNHEYRTRGAAPYFEYFGPNAGTPGEGWYAYEAGGWRIYALNSACAQIGGCEPNSAQYGWLSRELAEHPQACVMAYWHNPLWASGYYEGSDNMVAIFELLYDANAELVLTGHDHVYERLVPVDPRGRPDPDRGIRHINVGTGSSALHPFRGPPLDITEARDNTTHGVLKLELDEGAYRWEFLPVDPDGFSDNGSDGCH